MYSVIPVINMCEQVTHGGFPAVGHMCKQSHFRNSPELIFPNIAQGSCVKEAYILFISLCKGNKTESKWQIELKALCSGKTVVDYRFQIMIPTVKRHYNEHFVHRTNSLDV